MARGSSSAKGKGKWKGESSTNPLTQSKTPPSTASVSASEHGPPRSSVPMKADGVRNRKGVGDGDDDDDDDIIVVDSEEELMIVPGAGS